MVTLTTSEKVMQTIVVLILILLSAIAILPLISVLAISLSSKSPVDLNLVTLWPRGLTLDSWKQMMSRSDIWQSFAVTFFTTLIGTALSLLLNAITAYPLAKKEFKPAKVIMILFVITMVFKAPMIPYFLTVKGVGLYNNPAVLVIPQILNAFNMIIMVSFFRQFPAELEEAARMEGCGYFRLLFQMVLPLSKAVLATVGLFYAVVLWNQFQHPLMFLTKPEWFPLQIKIRQLIAAEDQLPRIGDNVTANFNATTLQSVVIIFAVVPILMVYPYLQKYFVKGAMLGSVKG